MIVLLISDDWSGRGVHLLHGQVQRDDRLCGRVHDVVRGQGRRSRGNLDHGRGRIGLRRFYWNFVCK